MKQTQKDILNEYAELKTAIKEMESKAKLLNLEVLDIMQEHEVKEIELSDMGKLSLGSRRSWKYSGEVKSLEDNLKAQKKIEEQTGDASYLESEFVVFKAVKHE